MLSHGWVWLWRPLLAPTSCASLAAAATVRAGGRVTVEGMGSHVCVDRMSLCRQRWGKQLWVNDKSMFSFSHIIFQQELKKKKKILSLKTEWMCVDRGGENNSSKRMLLHSLSLSLSHISTGARKCGCLSKNYFPPHQNTYIHMYRKDMYLLNSWIVKNPTRNTPRASTDIIFTVFLCSSMYD